MDRNKKQSTTIGYLGILVDLCIHVETLVNQQPSLQQLINKEGFTKEEQELLQDAIELNGMTVLFGFEDNS